MPKFYIYYWERKKNLRECCAVYREKFTKLRIFIVLSLDVNKVNNSI